MKSVYVDILCSKGQTDRFLWQKWIPDVFIDFRSPLLCPSPGHNYGVSILSSINFCKTFLRLTRVRKIAKTWNSAKLISYLSLIVSLILDCFYPVVLVLFFRCVTVKTSNRDKNPSRKTRRISEKLDPLTRAATGLCRTSDALMGGKLSHHCTNLAHQTTYLSGEVGLKQKAIMLVKDKRNICSNLKDRERIGLASALAYHSVSHKIIFVQKCHDQFNADLI